YGHTDGLQCAQLVELSINQLTVFEIETCGPLWVFYQQSPGLSLVTENAHKIRERIVIQMACQYYETTVLHSLLLTNSIRTFPSPSLGTSLVAVSSAAG